MTAYPGLVLGDLPNEVSFIVIFIHNQHVVTENPNDFLEIDPDVHTLEF
jgi:hypothetical protein